MRVKSGVRTKRRHNKVLKLAKGYWQSRSSQFKKAAEAVLHAGQYAYAGRRIKRRDFRSLWIVRINAAVRPEGLSYSQFVSKLKAKNISLDRKILSQIATKYPNVFKKIVSEVK
jgi:large subunit ribosomal protein L20